MAGNLPVMFRSGGGSPPSPSFDWYDYQAGTGYVTFYPWITREGAAGSDYFALTTRPVASRPNCYLEQGNGTTTYTFDILFNNYGTLNGTALSEWTQVVGACDAHIKIEVFHVDKAAAETSLGSITMPTTTQNTYYRTSGIIALTTKVITPGETLRVKITLVSNGNTIKVYCDPSSRVPGITETTTGATLRSDFAIHLPFMVDK